MAFLFNFNAKARDTITGFEGTVIARSDHVTGCNQYYLQPALDKDGKFVDGKWFDEDRVQCIAQGDNQQLNRGTPPGADIPMRKV